MTYTVRYAHLDSCINIKPGQEIKEGEFIGIAGNSGASDGRHLHIDCIVGSINKPWKLYDAEVGNVMSCPRQLNYFIDSSLFNSPLVVTTPYCDYTYMTTYGKVHHAYDLVPKDRTSWNIYWNRSKTGKVLFNEYDAAYGYCLLMEFNV